MLINLTNHPSEYWNNQQRAAATEQWGGIYDYPFPAVQAQCHSADIEAMAQKVVAEVLSFAPDAVLCQGEMTLCFTLVRLFQKHHIPVVAAASQREVKETHQPDGSARKEAVFRFVQFREYPILT